MNDIVKEINKMVNTDQKIRKELEESDSQLLHDELITLDKNNSSKLQEIVAKHGVLTISKVGKKASYNAWLLVQHSPDLDFQKKYLKLMNKDADDVDPVNIAYLTDRVLMYEQKKQIYGTQVIFNVNTQKYEPYKIENQEEVNSRRKNVGLEPIEDYLSLFNKHAFKK